MIAVIITIMVLELKVPRDTTLTSLRSLAPQFLRYLLSFFVVAIMWVNHHHRIHAARRADARLLWSNNVLLFWMSLVPFVTAYMGNNPRAIRGRSHFMEECWRYARCRLYCCAPRLCAIIRANPEAVSYHRRVQMKNIYSLLLYLASAPLAFLDVRVSFCIFVFVALSYFLPEGKLAEV